MSSLFETNDKFARYFYAQAREILARNLINIREATDIEDRRSATDMVLVGSDVGSVGLRVRRSIYDYRDFTIRSWNRGLKTEIDKIKEGEPHWYLYGWTKGTVIDEYILIDMDLFREKQLWSGRFEHDNKDGATRFIAIPLNELYYAGALRDFRVSILDELNQKQKDASIVKQQTQEKHDPIIKIVQLEMF